MMFFWPLHVLAIVVTWSSISSAVTATSTNQTDRSALLAFKDKIHGDPTGALSSWNTSVHFCDWPGVTCSRDRVTVLDLSSHKLEGTLSPYIGNLTFLTEIDLADNKFHDEIPQEIGNLLQLQRLNFSQNSFSGRIPINLSRCSNLTMIEVMDNMLLGEIPVEITSLSNLSILNLNKNKLNGSLPSSLGNLTALRFLSVGENSFTGSIPEDLCCLRSLTAFKASLNQLTGLVPSCLYNISSLKEFAVSINLLEGSLPPDIGFTLPNLVLLILGNNRFSGLIPFSLANASKLQMITFEENQFTGQVPGDLGRLQDLRILSLHSNRLGSRTGDDWNFIHSLTNCSNLKWLTVVDNFLKGPIPESIANLSPQITNIELGGNQMHGRIPTGIGNLVNLQVLDFGRNNLTGTILPVIGTLTDLRRLFLGGNQFTGQIPASFGNLTQLLQLDLSFNKLDGRIPSSLGSCENLVGIDLSNNRLNGSIPTEILGLSSLKIILNLWNNELSGSLPQEVGNLTDLVQFDVYGNRLSGRIPSTLGECVTLKYLNLAKNFFEGDIPESLSNLNGIETIDFANNSFSGEIPEFLGRLRFLTSLNLSHNALEGQVPKVGVFANASELTIVGNSKLCGGVIALALPRCHIQTLNKKGKSLDLKVVIPVVLGLFLVLLLGVFLMLYRRNRSKGKLSSPPSLNYRPIRISYAELNKATNNFSHDNLIGVGGYGSVYKGVLDKVDHIVAVKVLNLQQRGASKSFLAECNALSSVRHRNLLKIITACSSVDFQGNDFKALVFEFMPNGSLEEWLHPKLDEKSKFRNLTFLQRLNICIDVAYALDYLHHHSEPPVIHCDVKSSNILLDDDMTAHVADFGLAKIFSTPSNAQKEASSFAVKGSIGYVPPEYGMGNEVSTQGDVYSYGILLLEMFIGKRPTDSLFENGLSLHNFAKLAFHEQVMSTVDPRMFLNNHDASGNGNQDDSRSRIENYLVSIIRVGVTCSSESTIERMEMGDVVSELCRVRDYHQGSIEGDAQAIV